LIIGAGPGGYAAAFRAAALGQEVLVVDLQKNWGGTCLNYGCIPSKALLHAAKLLTDAKDAQDIGIEFGSAKINLDKMREWKNSVVSRLNTGLTALAKQRKITSIEGRATFIDDHTAKIDKNDGTIELITFEHAIIATGSVPVNLPFAPASPRIINSTMALDLEDVPSRLLLVGGGYIGLELGTAYAALGSEVTVCEMTPTLLPGADRDLVSVLERRLKKTFKNILLNTKIVAFKESGENIAAIMEDKNSQRQTAEFDKVLIAVGRKPATQNLGLVNVGITADERGFITVNPQRQTANKNIYAVGDVTGNPMLAHKASHEGIIAAEAIAGQESAFSPEAIPAVVFTDPEIAWAGLTETEAKEKNIEIKIVKMPWGASGRAVTLNRTDGLTKIIADPKTKKVLGVAIVGIGAGELISEAVLGIELGAKITDLKKTIHPHPTLSESIMDTAGLL